jgi:hypothetical protein
MPAPTRLTVCLPSRSNLSEARQTLDSVRHLSGFPGIEVVVSDNSDDATKRTQLQSWASDRFRYLRSEARDVIGNWTHALRHAGGDLACFLSDDDQLVALPGFEADRLGVGAQAAGIRPQMALYTEERGLYSFTRFEIPESRAIDRVRAYFERNGGANTTLFSCYRRPLLTDLLEAIDAHHPTRGGYTDWSMVLGLVSSGPLLADHRLLYVYNNRNWASAPDIARNTRRTFADAGLPDDTAQILQPLTALDSFATICRASSAVPADEKIEAAWFAVVTYFDGFAARLREPAFADSLDAARREIATAVVRDARTHVDKLAACLMVVEAWLPGLAQRYQHYFAATLDPGVLAQL